MVTEEQKKIFNDFLNNIFNETINKNNETYQKTNQWLKNMYYRYINNTLPGEHKLALEARLRRRNISVNEFLETKGSIELLQELSKKKKAERKKAKELESQNKIIKETPVETKPEVIEESPVEAKSDENKVTETKTDTTEGLEKLRDELDKRITCLKSKITKRNRALYRLTDEACEEIEKQIDEAEQKIKEINKKIAELTPKKETETINDATQKKIEKLVNENREKNDEILALKNEIAKFREERASYSTRYREEAERTIAIYKKETDEQFATKLEEEVQRQISRANQKNSQTKGLQVAHIKRLLLRHESISLNDIKYSLEKSKVSTANLDVAINELRTKIPGIVKSIDVVERTPIFSISGTAMDRWDVLKNNTNSVRISNVFDGTVSFIERSDVHASLRNTEDDLKKMFDPILNFSSANGNLPIVDFGDFMDTLKEIEYSKWVNHDKEAIELACKFLKNLAKTLATVPTTKFYFLNGNHEKHLYLAGIDPLEIMYEYCNNLIPLGAEKGSFMIGNDKIGALHGIDNIPYLVKSDSLCKEIEEKLPKIVTDEIYSFIAHFHIGAHYPLQKYSLVSREPLVITAEVEDGTVTKMDAQKLKMTKKAGFDFDSFPTEIYNSNYQYKKIKSH